jgi:predicted porin
MEPEKNASITNRNSRVGFTGESWGGVWYGTNENIYERYLYTTDPLDGAMGVGGNLSILGSPGYNVVFDAPRGAPFGTAGFYRRTEHTIWYDSPNWNGLTFGIAYGMPAFKTTCAAVAGPACVNGGDTVNPYEFSGGIKYAGTSIPLELWFAAEQHKNYFGIAAIKPVTAVGDGSTDTGLQFGAAYTLGDVRIFGVYEQLKYKHSGAIGLTDVTEYKRNAWGVGLKWNLASGYFGAQYLQALNASCTLNSGGCNADDTGGSLIGAGYFHNMSKQTQVYLVGAYIQNKDLASYSPAGGLGVFNGAVAPGQDVTSVTIGVKHSF